MDSRDYDKKNSKEEPKELLPVLDSDVVKHSEADQAGDATFVDIMNLESLAENSRRTFEAQDAILKPRN